MNFHIEYCIRETFNPSCGQGEVIEMQYALYGRMKIGKCLDSDFFLGCSVNVLNITDKMCSGRKTCSIPVISTEMAEQAHCLHKDMTAYLEAEFFCRKGTILTCLTLIL